MRAIAISNHKGGSGKTTTAVNLAAALAERDRRVLVVDLDPQGSASSWLGVHAADGDGTGAGAGVGAGENLDQVLTAGADLRRAVRPSQVPGVELVPATTGLAGAERLLAQELGAETILRQRFRRLPSDRFDYVLIDTPPSVGLLTTNALTAADEVLVPVESHVLALRGVAQLLSRLDLVRERLNPQLRLGGLLACRVDGRTRHAQEVLEQLRARFGDAVYRTVIRENVRLAEAPSFGEPILRYDARSTGASDYRALADEVIQQEREA